jgi:ribonuclease HI
LNTSRHEQARLLNEAIDRALSRPTPRHRRALLDLAKTRDTGRVAERVRQRATWLSRHDRTQAQHYLSNRDALILALYADRAPVGWAIAWCDGSSVKHDAARHAGIGAILMDASGRRIAELSLPVGDKSAFEAEIAALAAVAEMALEHDIEQLRVYTDSKALVQLWHERRQDPRLASIHPVVSRFRRLRIRPIPRLHNQAANALARQASLKSSVQKEDQGIKADE